jgi:RimJ/RimL family protein N-acetyltransferase
LNEPSFKAYVGDKGIRTRDDARQYLREVVTAHYATHGFGLFRVRLKAGEMPAGICGLVQRAQFADPDLGFAFLCEHWSQGYAFEASRAVLDSAARDLGMTRILAMADANNAASVRLLRKLGFRYTRMVTMAGDSDPVCQYGLEI